MKNPAGQAVSNRNKTRQLKKHLELHPNDHNPRVPVKLEESQKGAWYKNKSVKYKSKI